MNILEDEYGKYVLVDILIEPIRVTITDKIIDKQDVLLNATYQLDEYSGSNDGSERLANAELQIR